MASDAQENFNSRVDAVFGALDTSSSLSAPPSSGWRLSDTQVYRQGKDAEYSSEEEEEARREDVEREANFPETFLDLEDEPKEGQERPSRAFCRAIDNEQEYDDNDAIASGFLDERKEPQPSRQMQVLDDNIFDQASRRGGVGILPNKVPPDPVPVSMMPPSAKFRGYVASSQLLSEKSSVSQLEMASSSGEGKPLPPKARQKHRAKQGAGASFVPDHVRHPERYTAYELDEPITVGSGDFGTASNAARSQEATNLESRQDALQPEQDLPGFGRGIAFQPQKRGEQLDSSSSKEHAARKGSAGVSIPPSVAEDVILPVQAPQDGFAEDDTAMEEVVASLGDIDSPADFIPKARRQRNLRTRS